MTMAYPGRKALPDSSDPVQVALLLSRSLTPRSEEGQDLGFDSIRLVPREKHPLEALHAATCRHGWHQETQVPSQSLVIFTTELSRAGV